jgi:Zinc carboxypeptidase
MKIILTFVFFLAQLVFSQSSTEWITYFESSGFTSTPNYQETMDYFQKLANYSFHAELKIFGVSPQGRELKCLVVSKDNLFEPDQYSNRNKPVLLMINGIHSGEIEGKDASMLLLRDILVTKEKENLLDSLILLVIPIFNVDGHERTSKYNRINQNGPEEMGWRTTAQNLNLNRDWMKAAAPEMQAMLKLIVDWMPDFIIDSHTTDGADYQYTITYAVEKYQNIYPETAYWLNESFVPFLEYGVEKRGFLIYQYIYLKTWLEGFEGGMISWAATPRFSTGYAAVQNRPSILIETHMIKPYKDRVYSTKAAFETVMEFLNNNSSLLIAINRRADENTITDFTTGIKYLPVAYDNPDIYEEIILKGYKYFWKPSEISGNRKLVYTDENEDFLVNYYNDMIVTDSVSVPNGYIIPQEWWQQSISKIKLHGVESERFPTDTTILVTRYKFNNVIFDSLSYEGRQRVGFDIAPYQEEVVVRKGDVYISTKQRTLRVIVNLLEPSGGDSYIQWGYMNSIFERAEYYENYVMEEVAEKMLSEDPELEKEFNKRLAKDDSFRADPQARLNFFYERSPYYDKNYLVYPILRVE